MELNNLIYNGALFPNFCNDNNIPFKEFEARFKRMRNNKKLDKYSDEYLVEYIINNFYNNKHNRGCPCKYYVGNISLADYARKNGVLPFSMRGAVQSGLKKDPNANTEELAKEFVKRNKDRFKYTYDGYPLTEICRMYNLCYGDILRVFYEDYPNRNTMSEEEKNAAVKDIVDTFIKNKNNKSKRKELKYEI